MHWVFSAYVLLCHNTVAKDFFNFPLDPFVNSLRKLQIVNNITQSPLRPYFSNNVSLCKSFKGA